MSTSLATAEKGKMLSLTFIALTVVLAFVWYMYTSGASAFNQIVYVIDHVVSSISGQFLDPQAAEGLQMLLTETQGPLGLTNRTLNYLNQIFIIIGVLTLFLQQVSRKAGNLSGASPEGETRFGKEYAAFSYVSLAILAAGVVVPYFASSFNMTRLYHVTLFFLAPFYVMGGIMVLKWITANRLSLQNKGSYLFLVLIVSILFHLFTTGFVYTVAGRETSLVLNYDSHLYRITHHEDIAAAGWLYAHSDSGVIYADDEYGGAPFIYADPSKSGRISTITPENIEEIEDGDYIHLRYGAISTGKIYSRASEVGFIELDDTMFIQEGNKIYDSGSAIYQMPNEKEMTTR